jgi:hypothetical protein
MELDVLICTHGARGWVERCVESLMRSERRGEFRVLVHDNKASERDGTREYLENIADCGLPIADLAKQEDAVQSAIGNRKLAITVFYDERDLAHGQALDFLAERVEAPWFLAMDSDVEMVRRDWLDEVERVIEAHPGMGVCAAAQATWVTGGAQYSMPRVDPSFVLVATEFFRREGLSFTVLVMKAEVMNPLCLPGALKGKRQITVAGDTGWQLFHAALRGGLVIPEGGRQKAEGRNGDFRLPNADCRLTGSLFFNRQSEIGNRQWGFVPSGCAAACALRVDAGRADSARTGYFLPMPAGLRSCYVHHGSRSIRFEEMGGVMNAGDLVEVVYSLGPGATGTIRGRLALRGNPDIVLTETVETVDGKEVQGLAAVIPRRREILIRLIERKGSGTEKRG